MKSCTFGDSIFCWVPLIIAVFSGLRLAKFNVDPRQHKSFLGLPTPACAVICGSLCYFIAEDPASFLCGWAAGNVFVPVLSVVLSFLLVSKIPMFSMKFSKDDDKTVKGKRLSLFVNILICVIIVVLTGLNWSAILLLAFTVYVLMNVAFAIFRI